MSLPAELSDRTLARLTDALSLTVTADTPLTSPMAPQPVGRLRVLRSEPADRVDKVVTVSLVVPTIGLDSHMIFAFTPADSAVPHFTLDSVRSSEYHAMHLDLIPRVELATHLDYLDTTHLPLTPLLEAAWEIDGVSPAAVGPRQRAMMSPWMVVARATEDAFTRLGATVDAYLDHWLALADKGVTAEGDLAARDRVNRANLFSPEVDPVWHQVTRLLGADQAERVRGELLS
ncbi:hypothetical protein OHA77_03320 [Streptosporangium sp. NBC_01639]|uniref:hypothetical protein n=1 Tax=Streptosporangium sp. NBC_01639 TaxID=2975948 RepID=UPI0038636EEE|nr:hypothetical protein OHA77_03320 [Streptosporangium sp. NBC_01639]